MILEKEGGLVQTEFLEPSRQGYCLSCLDAVKTLQETGRFAKTLCSRSLLSFLIRFGEAQNELEDALRDSENWREMAVACLLLGELFNKWGAASPSYTIAIMEKGAIYANRAVQLWQIARDEKLFEENPEDMDHLSSALYWKALNLASVAGLGGCERWTVLEALQAATEAAEQMSAMEDKKRSASEVKARRDFVREFLVVVLVLPQVRFDQVEGIIVFCRAKALEGNHVGPTGT